METYDSISPLDARYIGPDEAMRERVTPYLSEAASIKYQLQVEVALLETLAECEICPPSVAEEARRAAEGITAEEVFEEERRIGHNVRALVNCLRKRLPEEARGFVHLFATSNDILDTSRSLAFRDFARKVLIPDLMDLVDEIASLARQHASLPQIGRTHGQYAEPITFGYALSVYVSRLGGRIDAIDRAQVELRGKLSGAVGAHNALSLHDPENPWQIEEKHLGRLGLRASDTHVSTQLVEPEPVAVFIYQALLALSVMADLSDDVRHLVRSEIREVTLVQGAKQVGSSTMPHKTNPVAFENIKGIWKAFAPRIVTVLSDQLSEHQRDLTNSASGRFMGETLAAVDYSAVRLRKGMSRIQPDQEGLRRNLDACKDTIVAEPLYVTLALSGHGDGYGKVRSLLKIAGEKGITLMEAARQDEEVARILETLPAHQAKVLEDPASYTGDAADRAIATCDIWQKRLKPLRDRISDQQD